MLADLIESGNAKVNLAFSNEGRYIGCWKKNERNRVVLDKGDIESIVTSELYV